MSQCGHYSGCGCPAAPCCLACPLSTCIYEQSGVSAYKEATVLRRQETQKLVKAGLTVNQIAITLGHTRRTIYNDLAVKG